MYLMLASTSMTEHSYEQCLACLMIHMCSVLYLHLYFNLPNQLNRCTTCNSRRMRAAHLFVQVCFNTCETHNAGAQDYETFLWTTSVLYTLLVLYTFAQALVLILLLGSFIQRW